MRAEPAPFFSERARLDADLYLPDDAHGPVPAVVACSGYQGLKAIHPERFARALTPHGYAVLAFDYRGFGASEGERGRLVPQEQVADVRAGASRLEGHAAIDADRIAVLGWALGGGVAIAAAAEDERFRSCATVQAIGDGERLLRYQHGDDGLRDLRRRIAEDRVRAATTGRSEIVDPFDIIVLDEVTLGYVDAKLEPVAGFHTGVTLESADRLLSFRPEDVVGRIAPRPLLLVHGEDNRLHPLSESEALAAAAGGPCELSVLDGVGHTEWMHDDDPVFGNLVTQLVGFLSTTIGEAAA